MSKMNDDLLRAQKEWEKECYNPLKEEYEKNEATKGKLSCAFSFGVSNHYIEAKKKIMIVGQEANGHTFDYKNWGLENWQKWAVDYLDYQVYGEKPHNRDFSTNSSPFWHFIRELSKDYGVCWNNLDKVRRYIQNNGVELTEDYLLEYNDYDKNKDRSRLHEKIFDSKSLLHKEIEIAKPNIVIFAVGPKNPYYHSLSLAFFDGDKVDEHLNVRGIKYPQIKNNNFCCEISEDLNLDMPAFYTYHPHYLSRKRILNNVIKNIITKEE